MFLHIRLLSFIVIVNSAHRIDVINSNIRDVDNLE